MIIDNIDDELSYAEVRIHFMRMLIGEQEADSESNRQLELENCCLNMRKSIDKIENLIRDYYR